jgi:hypothetical protein
MTGVELISRLIKMEMYRGICATRCVTRMPKWADWSEAKGESRKAKEG